MSGRSSPAPTRRRLLALAALATVLGPVPRAFADDAEAGALAFLDGIYGTYRKGGPGITLSGRKDYQRYFTAELAGLIAADDARAEAAGDVPNLDADPFVDAQDTDIGAIKVSVAKTAGGMTGTARVTNFGETRTIRLKLVKTGSGWRIDDIIWPEGSLRGLYAQ